MADIDQTDETPKPPRLVFPELVVCCVALNRYFSTINTFLHKDASPSQKISFDDKAYHHFFTPNQYTVGLAHICNKSIVHFAKNS